MKTQGLYKGELFSTDISVSSLKSKNFKKQGAFISKFGFWEDPPQSIQLVPKHSFLHTISVSVAQISKIKKTRCIYFQIWLLGGPSRPIQLVPPTHSTGPQTTFFTNISVSVAQMSRQVSNQQLWSTEIDVGKTGRQLPKVSITKSVKKWITTGSMCQIQKAVYEILFIKFDVTRHTRRKYSSLFINVQDWERRTRRKYSSLFINEQDWEREVDVEEYMASSSTVAWASHTLSCVEFVMWRSCLVLNHMYDKVKRASKEDLQPDVVEEKGVEDAAQLLSLVDVPQDESQAEVVAARLLQL